MVTGYYRTKKGHNEFEYYRPDYGEKENDYNTFWSDFEDVVDAAEDLADVKFSDWDYSVPDELYIRKAGCIEWSKVGLEVRNDPVFYARLRR